MCLLSYFSNQLEYSVSTNKKMVDTFSYIQNTKRIITRKCSAIYIGPAEDTSDQRNNYSHMIVKIKHSNKI